MKQKPLIFKEALGFLFLFFLTIREKYVIGYREEEKMVAKQEIFKQGKQLIKENIKENTVLDLLEYAVLLL